MVTGQFSKNSFKDALDEVKHITHIYKDIGGVFCWEYCNSPPDMNDPSDWARLMRQYVRRSVIGTFYNYIKSFF